MVNKNENNELREKEKSRLVIGQRLQHFRHSLPNEIRQLSEFASKIGLSESLLSRIESGKASLPLDAVERIADKFGCRPEALIAGDAYPNKEKDPLQSGIDFLRQAQYLGVDGLFPDRTLALGYLLQFAQEMRSGEIKITGSSLRGLEQKSEHGFVRRLIEFGNNPLIEMKVIMTHPMHGPEREHQENRPEGSIVREILTGIIWCIEVLKIEPENIKLSKASPSSFSIFLLDGPEGRGLINPYPTMRQAFLSFTITVHRGANGKGPGEAVSIFETYLQANFRDPWDDQNVTVDLIKGLEECKEILSEDKGKTDTKELRPHKELLELTLKKCSK